MCTVGSKSRDRTLQDGCLIDECETVTEECIPQGKGVTFPVATFIVFLIQGISSTKLYNTISFKRPIFYGRDIFQCFG